jgi:hypothetical protein
MKMEQCSKTSAYKIQTPGNYPEENLQQQSLVVFILIVHVMETPYRQLSCCVKA